MNWYILHLGLLLGKLPWACPASQMMISPFLKEPFSVHRSQCYLRPRAAKAYRKGMRCAYRCMASCFGTDTRIHRLCCDLFSFTCDRILD